MKMLSRIGVGVLYSNVDMGLVRPLSIDDYQKTLAMERQYMIEQMCWWGGSVFLAFIFLYVVYRKLKNIKNKYGEYLPFKTQRIGITLLTLSIVLYGISLFLWVNSRMRWPIYYTDFSCGVWFWIATSVCGISFLFIMGYMQVVMDWVSQGKLSKKDVVS